MIFKKLNYKNTKLSNLWKFEVKKKTKIFNIFPSCNKYQIKI